MAPTLPTEHSAQGLVMYARELEAHMRGQGLGGAIDTLAWARGRNTEIGWAGYDAQQRVVQVHLDEDELFLVVGLAVTLRDDSAFYGALLGPEDA